MQFTLKSFLNIVDEEKIGNILQKFVISNIHSLQNPHNRTRQLIIMKMREEFVQVKENEAVLQELQKWKETWIANWNATEKIKRTIRPSTRKSSNFY
ncbi:hypothetical protein ACUIAK_16355 [Bacillus cytotoxicus]